MAFAVMRKRRLVEPTEPATESAATESATTESAATESAATESAVLQAVLQEMRQMRQEQSRREEGIASMLRRHDEELEHLRENRRQIQLSPSNIRANRGP